MISLNQVKTWRSFIPGEVVRLSTKVPYKIWQEAEQLQELGEKAAEVIERGLKDEHKKTT